MGDGASDIFKLFNAVGAYEHENGSLLFCDENFLRPKAMQEIHKLRSQVTQLVQAYFPKADASLDLSMPLPSEVQLKVLRQLIAASFVDQVAIRKDLIDNAYAGRFSSCRDVAYHALHVADDVFIHPTSIVFDQPPPELICFHELFRTNKPYLKGESSLPVLLSANSP
jgi:ATP-dependent RNA helicase DHX37/DHR1